MNLSKAQQGLLWPMLEAAWLMHARQDGIRPSDSKAKEQWRHAYLGEKLGVWSLKQIPRGGTLFARVMGALQEIARNGIDWIIKAGTVTDADGARHHLRELLDAHDIAETYACGIAKNALRLPAVPESLDEIDELGQLNTLARIVHAQAERIAAAQTRTPEPAAVGADTPF